MLAKEMALEIATQAPAEAFAPDVRRQPTYIILDAPCQALDVEIMPIEQIEQQLRVAARERLVSAQQGLAETQTRIQQERAQRTQQHEAARSILAALQETLANLEMQRTELERRAQVFLNVADRERVHAQIHLSFNAKHLELEESVQKVQQELDTLSLEHYTAIIAEELELGLFQSDVETLQQAAPDVANQINQELEAPLHLANALELARTGNIVDAESEIAQARNGKISESELAAAETAIAEAKRRAAAREIVAAIQNISANLPGATTQLKRIAQTAQTLGIAANVESFLNHALRQARTAAMERYREATIHADYLATQGLVPCIGDGRIEAWKQSNNGWTLVEVWSHQQGTWIGHQPRVRVTRTEIPRRVRRSRWYRQQQSSPSGA